MRVLILGKTGQVGHELAFQAQLKHEVFAYSHLDLDITNLVQVKDVIQKILPEVIINTTAFHVVTQCEVDPEKAFLINSIAVGNLASLALENNSKFITLSTDYVFDGMKKNAYVENDVPFPLQQYGISKLAGEYSALSKNPNSIIVRTCVVYGGKTGSLSKKGNFVLTILKQAKNTKELEVSMDQTVSPTYAPDLAGAIIRLMELKSKQSGIFHLVNEGMCTFAEFAQEIVVLAQLQTKIIPVDRKGIVDTVKKPLFSALKNTRSSELGILLPEWKDAIRRYCIALNV